MSLQIRNGIKRLSSLLPPCTGQNRPISSLSNGSLNSRKVCKNPSAKIGGNNLTRHFTVIEVAAITWIGVGARITDDGLRDKSKFQLILGLFATLMGIGFAHKARDDHDKYLAQMLILPGGVVTRTFRENKQDSVANDATLEAPRQ